MPIHYPMTKCDKCGLDTRTINIQEVVDLNDNGEIWRVCEECHGDYFCFRDRVGDSSDHELETCERCGTERYWFHLTNVDGELVCTSTCAKAHREDLEQYRRMEWPESGPMPWNSFVYVGRFLNCEIESN